MSRMQLIAIVWLGIFGLTSKLMAADESPPPSGQLVYSQLTDGTWQIWQRDFVTNARAQRTFSPGDKRLPGWAPGGRIAYHTSNQHCYLISVDGQEDEPWMPDLWPLRDVSWSPDGTQAVFARFRTELVDSANIWIAGANSTGQRMVTQERGLQYNPRWSPDGQHVAYVGSAPSGTYELFIINVDGTQPRQLTQNRAQESLPAWSPDGQWISFSSNVTGDYEIWVIRADGSGLTQLTQSPGLDTRPFWSPDGRYIAFTTNRSGALEIWLMKPDGTDQQVLEQAEGGVCDAAWR